MEDFYETRIDGVDGETVGLFGVFDGNNLSPSLYTYIFIYPYVNVYAYSFCYIHVYASNNHIESIRYAYCTSSC